MRICGFTIVRNAARLGYPFEESIRSLLPLVDELVVAVGRGQPKDAHTSEAVHAIPTRDPLGGRARRISSAPPGPDAGTGEGADARTRLSLRMVQPSRTAGRAHSQFSPRLRRERPVPRIARRDFRTADGRARVRGNAPAGHARADRRGRRPRGAEPAGPLAPPGTRGRADPAASAVRPRMDAAALSR